jgi:hypothetical protein
LADVAWTTIKTVAADGSVTLVPPGESVDASKLNTDDAGFEQLKEAGAIRETTYPDDVGTFESVRERNLRKINEAMQAAEESAFANMPELDLAPEEVPPEEPPPEETPPPAGARRSRTGSA